MSEMKGTSRRIWLLDEEMNYLIKLSDGTGLGQTEILSQVIKAGLRCIREDGNRIVFPLRFLPAVGHEPAPGKGRVSYLNERGH